MLKRSHRARTDPRKEAYVSVYYKAQMLPQDRFHNCFPHTNEDPTLAEQDKNKSDTNFLFFFEIRIVLHSGEWLTCGRRRRPPTRSIIVSQDGPRIIIIL